MKKAILLALVAMLGVVTSASATVYILPVPGNDGDIVAWAPLGTYNTSEDYYDQTIVPPTGRLYDPTNTTGSLAAYVETPGDPTTGYIDVMVWADGADVGWLGSALIITISGGTVAGTLMVDPPGPPPPESVPDEISAGLDWFSNPYTDAQSFIGEASLCTLYNVGVAVLSPTSIELAGAWTIQPETLPQYPQPGQASASAPIRFGRIGVYDVTGPLWIESVAWDSEYPGTIPEEEPSEIVIVPEPATISLLALAGLGFLRRRRN